MITRTAQANLKKNQNFSFTALSYLTNSFLSPPTQITFLFHSVSSFVPYYKSSISAALNSPISHKSSKFFPFNDKIAKQPSKTPSETISSQTQIPTLSSPTNPTKIYYQIPTNQFCDQQKVFIGALRSNMNQNVQIYFEYVKVTEEKSLVFQIEEAKRETIHFKISVQNQT